MARPKIHTYWQERIRTIVANEPNVTNADIHKRLVEEAQQQGRDDYPSIKTVGNYRRQFELAPEEEQYPYRVLRWPDSFLHGALPWEASAAAVELLQEWVKRHGVGRPTNRLALWYWRVRLARPDLPASECLRIATLAADTERGLRPEKTMRMLEADLLMPDGAAGFSPGGRYTYPASLDFYQLTEALSVQGWKQVAEALVKEEYERRWYRHRKARRLHAEGKPLEEIAAEVNASVDEVKTWIARGEKEGS